MAVLNYSHQALQDLERLVDFLLASDPAAAIDTVALIEEAVQVLVHHPLIGRSVEHGLRELVISRGRTGYVALYRYREAEEAILILALRHQREAGFWQHDV